MATLTAANSVLTLTVAGLFTLGQRLQGFATDDAFTSTAIATADVAMGVDARLSGGYTPVPKPITIALQADSDSNAIFEAWAATQDQLREALEAELGVSIPSIRRRYTCLRGFLTAFPPIPDARRTLGPRRYTVTFESIFAVPT